jgi:ATP-dependent Clp protease ATP-binding subunit ClpA
MVHVTLAGSGTALSQNPHQSIRRALTIAQERHRGHATSEHLLHALTDDPDAAPIMRACNVDLEKLRDALLMSPLQASERTRARPSIVNPRPGAHVLVSTFAGPAARFLQQQGMTR